jgi:hypothetical protein
MLPKKSVQFPSCQGKAQPKVLNKIMREPDSEGVVSTTQRAALRTWLFCSAALRVGREAEYPTIPEKRNFCSRITDE